MPKEKLPKQYIITDPIWQRTKIRTDKHRKKAHNKIPKKFNWKKGEH